MPLFPFWPLWVNFTFPPFIFTVLMKHQNFLTKFIFYVFCFLNMSILWLAPGREHPRFLTSPPYNLFKFLNYIIIPLVPPSFFFFFSPSFTRFLDHTQRRTTVGRTPLDEWSARHKDLYLTTPNTLNRQRSMPPVGFQPTISAGERPQT
jgi:hypothetical protein